MEKIMTDSQIMKLAQEKASEFEKNYDYEDAHTWDCITEGYYHGFIAAFGIMKKELPKHD